MIDDVAIDTAAIDTAATGGRDAWLHAGHELLRRGGIGSVKLQSLVAELGLTTGSFYHHFDNIAAYHSALAAHFATALPAIGIDAARHPDPKERLRLLHAYSTANDLADLDAAMRDWAGSNDEAAQAVADSDLVLLGFMAACFAELGYDDADLRATMLLSAAVARVKPFGTAKRTSFEAILEVLAPTS